MPDGTSNKGPLKCRTCGWPVVRHLTPCPPELPLLPGDMGTYDATDCDVPLMRPADG
jgi:hypothetical protein